MSSFLYEEEATNQPDFLAGAGVFYKRADEKVSYEKYLLIYLIYMHNKLTLTY